MYTDYQCEIDSFKKNFNIYKDKKIVLYGIGRYTASLIPAITEFNIIGLMDRDLENIGKNIYGLPILSKDQVEERADLIIINTSESYWKIIYSRICNLKVPVYFLNGQKACKENKTYHYNKNTYWQKTYEGLVDKTSEFEIISFDIFDTLIMWKVYSPQDIYKLTELRIKNKLNLDIDFYRVRLEIELNNRSKNITLEEIYQKMNVQWNFPVYLLNRVKEIEVQVTKESLFPRKIMVDLCNTLMKSKKIYFISDMYLPKDILSEILFQCGIKKIEHLWISGELKKDKRSGSIWEKYINEVGSEKKLLHIGDNLISDIKNPQQYGIETYYVMSSSDMMKNSSIGSMVPNILGLSESMFIGLFSTSLLNSPFALNKTKGLVYIEENDKLGYCLFGAVICSFLLWLIIQAKEKKIDRLVFFLRDGYFLEKDYLYISNLLNEEKLPKSSYLAISRRLALISSYNKESDLDTIIDFPYVGIFNEYMLDRFDINIPLDDENYSNQIALPHDHVRVKKWLMKYKSDIIHKITQEKNNYHKYLTKMELKKSDAVIDLWFYGNNQYYLSKALNMHMNGFYFAANKSQKNKCLNNNSMFSCFQKDNDLVAEQCNLYKNSLWIESFLTAPYGMIKALDEKGNYICAPQGRNQLRFEVREVINDAVCEFIKDYLLLSGGMLIELNCLFVDDFFGELNCGDIEVSDKIKKSFYYDNSMVKRSENPIFG